MKRACRLPRIQVTARVINGSLCTATWRFHSAARKGRRLFEREHLGAERATSLPTHRSTTVSAAASSPHTPPPTLNTRSSSKSTVSMSRSMFG